MSSRMVGATQFAVNIFLNDCLQDVQRHLAAREYRFVEVFQRKKFAFERNIYIKYDESCILKWAAFCSLKAIMVFIADD